MSSEENSTDESETTEHGDDTPRIAHGGVMTSRHGIVRLGGLLGRRALRFRKQDRRLQMGRWSLMLEFEKIPEKAARTAA